MYLEGEKLWAKQLRLCCMLAALLVMLLGLAWGRGGKEIEVSVHATYVKPWGWGGLELGVSEVNIKGKQPHSSYVLMGLGLKDQLLLSEEPQAHLKRCSTGQYPPGPLSESRQLATPHADCLILLLLWGDFLVEGPLEQRLESEEAEKAAGWRYLEEGFLFLLDEVKGIPDREQRLKVMEAVWKLDFRMKRITEIKQVPPTVRNAAIQYYSYVWNELPPAPETYNVFMLKFACGEALKQFYFGNVLDETPREKELGSDGLQFYEQAERFHQLVAPMARETKAPSFVLATLREGARFSGIGYAVFPGETTLRPLSILSHTDLEESEILLHGMLAAQQLGKTEFESREKALAAENNRLKVADLTHWLNIAAQQHDKGREADLRLQLTKLYWDSGDRSATEQQLERVCALLKEEGDLRTWAFRTVDLISYKVAQEQWRDALALIQQVRPLLIDGLVAPNLKEFVEYEALVHQKLGMPEPDHAWIEQLGQLVTDQPDPNEPDVNKRLAAWQAYFQKPGLPPAVRMSTGIELANTLRDAGQAGEAEELYKKLEQDIEHWRGLPGEVDLLGALLSLQAKRGNFGAFYDSFQQYKTISTKLNGDNWSATDGQHIAKTFFGLQDYHQAETLLQLHREADYWDALRDPLRWTTLEEDEVPLHDEDIVLEARIQMELGQKDQALRVLKSLDASTSQVGQGHAVVLEAIRKSKENDLLQLAEIYSSLGQPQRALDKVSQLLGAVDALDDTDMWSRAIILQGQSQLALGQPADKVAAKLEEVAPHVADYHELTASTAVDMDIFLGDYYGAQKSYSTAAQRLRRGLVVAETSGAVDQQIIIHRKLGELAARDHNAAVAAEQYRQSITLLNSISGGIPSDLGKVGYRAERNKAIPLLVETLYGIYQQSEDAKYLTQMFSVIEEGKARALAEMLAAGKVSASVDLAKVQKSLPSGSSILEYYFPEGASDRVYRLMIDRSSILVDVLNLSADQMTQQVEALLDKVKRPEQFDEASFKSRAMDLAKSLLPTTWMTEEVSSASRTLFVIPTGNLHLFPFGLLVDTHGHYLGEHDDLQIAYLPNASTLTRLAPRFREASRSAGFVNPALDEEQHETLSAAGYLQTDLTKAFQRWGGGAIQWEQSLSAEQFLAQVQQMDNVFLYAHGRFLPDDPTGSYVRFADDGGKGSSVSAARLLATHVGSGLWVLAACSSGVAKVRAGDEALGLPRALLLAGASMVVISLWDVDTGTSLIMMTRMYENLAQGMSVNEALHRASASLRQDGHPPYDWAPFILIGQPGFRQ